MSIFVAGMKKHARVFFQSSDTLRTSQKFGQSSIFYLTLLSKGGPRIVQILCSQGIVLLRNCTKWGLVTNTKNVLLERLLFTGKSQKTVLYLH